MSKKKPEISDIENYDYAWLNLGDIRKLQFHNKMLEPEWSYGNKIPELLVNTCRDPEYLHFFAKYILNINLFPIQTAVLDTLWNTQFPIMIGSRGSSKSFMLAIYAIMRAVLHQGSTIAVVGAAFRQSLVLFNYVDMIWDNAPVLRDICGGKKAAPKKDMSMATWHVGNSKVIFLPLGTGEKIRGQRANVVIADEFASISDEIFQVVVRGFASTKSAGTFESVQKEAKKAALKADGYELLDEEEESVRVKNILSGNQIIMAGTPTFAFNHFYKYYNQYKVFIESGGDKAYIKNALGEDVEIPSNFSPKDYAIIRIPAEVLPPGMMDHKVLEQAKMTMDKALYGNEYGAVFTQDSEGFYLASLLNSATCPIRKGSMEIRYGAKLYADMQIPCVMGIDPASENDNFAICIVELMDGYRGVVYVWSTNQKEFEKMRKADLIPHNIQDYHTFCIQHIRDLTKRFNIQMIVCDAQGGGAYVREGLKDPDKMGPHDIAILDMDDENIAMNEQGSRILKMIQFSDSKWRTEAHYGLRTDIANKLLIFPEHDASEVEISSRLSGAYESLGDVYVEILDCKTETTMIKHSHTMNGSEQWNVPKIKGLDSDEINRKLKKDRFTALLLANWGCRLIQAGNLMQSMGAAKYGYLVNRGGLRETVGQNNLIVPKITTLSNGRKIIL